MPDHMPEPPGTHPFELFAVCLPGLEPLLRAELRALAIAPSRSEAAEKRETVAKPDAGADGAGAEPDAGGVRFETDLDGLYGVSLRSGIAVHVLVRVARFGARSLQDLDVRGARVDWREWLPPGTPTLVKATCRRSRIYHSGAAAARIGRHLRAALGEPRPDGMPVRVRVRLLDNRCTISIDTSGAPLHRRAWRLDPGRAPLREDLAHALLLASGWDRESPLVDPMVGSGTIAIEAAGLARRLAPGRLRAFDFERFAFHDPGRYAAVREATHAEELSHAPEPIFASDRDANAIATARANAERAGVLGDLELANVRLSEALDRIDPIATTGALVTNPPYGKRLDSAAALADLYRALGNLAKRLPPAWHVAFTAADRRLALRSGLDLRTAFLADAGGSKVRAMCRAGNGVPGDGDGVPRDGDRAPLDGD